jgi:hypothetical protein
MKHNLHQVWNVMTLHFAKSYASLSRKYYTAYLFDCVIYFTSKLSIIISGFILCSVKHSTDSFTQSTTVLISNALLILTSI